MSTSNKIFVRCVEFTIGDFIFDSNFRVGIDEDVGRDGCDQDPA